MEKVNISLPQTLTSQVHDQSFYTANYNSVTIITNEGKLFAKSNLFRSM